MNRKERRANNITKPVPTYNMTAEQIAAIKAETKKQVMDNTIELVASVFMMKLHDRFGFGYKRMTDLLEDFNQTIECVNDGRVSLNDIAKWCADYGLDFNRK